MTESKIIPCSHCQTLNRVPTARMGDVPVCNSCGHRLLGAPPATLTSSGFDRFVTRSDLPVVIDFWADWCGPCIAMAPQFEAAAGDLTGTAVLARVETDQNTDLARRFGIQSIPTMLLLHHGQELARQSGAMQAGGIVAWVDAHVAR